ncbi:MAG: MgtC/SapB family protein [Bacillota bacterium]
MTQLLNLAARLVLAVVLGGVIGYEREHTQRPAGFRTHIVVCVAAALVMEISDYIFQHYNAFVNMDPARLGAQVISGIGFLGAGTIIRDGFNVKGLTTAASLWAVSCIGLAIGIGFCSGAVLATAMIYLTLLALKRFEHNISPSRDRLILIQSENRPGWMDEIHNLLERYGATVKKIEFENNQKKEGNTLVKLIVCFPDKNYTGVITGLQKISGITKASIR